MRCRKNAKRFSNSTSCQYSDDRPPLLRCKALLSIYGQIHPNEHTSTRSARVSRARRNQPTAGLLPTAKRPRHAASLVPRLPPGNALPRGSCLACVPQFCSAPTPPKLSTVGLPPPLAAKRLRNTAWDFSPELPEPHHSSLLRAEGPAGNSAFRKAWETLHERSHPVCPTGATFDSPGQAQRRPGLRIPHTIKSPTGATFPLSLAA